MAWGCVGKKMDDIEKHLWAQEKLCLAAAKDYPEDGIVKDSLMSLKSALKTYEEVKAANGSNDALVNECVRKYTKSVLDLTFKWEQIVVEGDFSKENTLSDMQKIVDTLAFPVTVCRLATREDKEKMSVCLDKEMEECLFWRVGALLYMFCYTVINSGDKSKVDSIREDLRSYCVAGAGYLELMLSTRTPLTKEEFESSDKGQVAQLLHEGVFSDTHMLALMYCGDLCFWCVELEQTNKISTPTSTGGDVTAGCTGGDVTAGRTGGDVTAGRTGGDVTAGCTGGDVTAGRTGGDVTAGRIGGDTTVGHKDVNTSSTQSHASVADNVASGKSPSGPSSLRPYQLMCEYKGEEYSDVWCKSFDPSRLCERYLSRYISVARGPLKELGWSYDRAVQLLVELRKQNRTDQNS